MAFLAAARLGFIYSPVPVQYREHELQHVISMTRARMQLTSTCIDGHSHAALAQTLVAEFADLQVLTYGDRRPEGAVQLESMFHPGGNLGVVPDASTRLTICWTSGTEGRPKGVVRDHLRWLCLAQAVMDAATLQAGAVLHHPFALPVFVSQLFSRPIDFTAAPPALLNLMLLREDVAAGANLGAVRVIGCGGAPLAPAMVKGFRDRFGVEIVNLFGSSEGGSLVSGPNDIPDPHSRAVCFPRWGVPGFDWASPMTTRVETRLVEPSTGEEISTPGHPGELRFRGPGVFSEYFEAPQATAAAFDEQGYYRSDDLFEIDGDRDQYYRFVACCKDLVIRGGVNISPEEVEGLLASHPNIADVAVVAYPDEVMGEKLCAILVPKGEARPFLENATQFSARQAQGRTVQAARAHRVAALAATQRHGQGA